MNSIVRLELDEEYALLPTPGPNCDGDRCCRALLDFGVIPILPCGDCSISVEAMEDASHNMPRRRKKVDYVALQSPLKRIPGMDIATVRDLIDIGIQEVEELNGRSPEALMEDILNRREQTPRDRLHSIRMAVYYAETDVPDPHLLHPWKWADTGSLL